MGYGNYIDPVLSFGGEGCERYTVGAGEHLSLRYVVMPGQSRDVEVVVDLAGEGASLEMTGLYLSTADEQVDIRVLVHHRVPGCASRQTFRGIAGGRARTRFDGRVVVAPGADRTEAFQEDHNLLLSDEAYIDALPQLEIYADDVQCSHGATVGRLNDDEQFYMRSRGIPEAEAKVLQILSFAAPVIGPDEELAARFESAVRASL